MPTVASWMMRIPDVISELERISAPVVDRAVFQKVFGVKRRRAIELMQRFGGFRSGNTVLVDRPGLIAGLHELLHGPDFRRECTRKQKLIDELDLLHRNREGARIVLPVSPDVQQRTSYDLPQGLLLEPGRLTVTFSGAEDLFGKLFELAQAAVNEFDGVRDAVSAHTVHASIAFLRATPCTPGGTHDSVCNTPHAAAPNKC